MCLYVVAILSAVTLLASTDAALKDVSSKGAESTLPPSVRSGHGGVSTNRLLRVHENDEERAISFKSIPGVGKVTDAVTKAKLAKYLKSSRTSDEVFTKMKLGKAGEKLFENPKFLAWVKYVDDYNMKNPDKATSMIPTLTAHYSDDVLAKMLAAATKVPTTKRLAESLETQLVKHWQTLKYTPDDALRALKLDKTLDSVLTDPTFLTLNKYVVDFNTWNPSKSTTMTELLSRSYGDAPVAKMLQQATKVKGTEGMASRLQSQQLTTWKEMGLTSDDVFRGTLKLDKQTGNLFESPNFLVWTKYVDDFSGEKTSSFDFLWKAFGEEKLAKMLIAPKDAKSNSVVGELQNSLIRKWLAMSPPKKPAEVSTILGTSSQGKTLSSLYRWNYKNQ